VIKVFLVSARSSVEEDPELQGMRPLLNRFWDWKSYPAIPTTTTICACISWQQLFQKFQVPI